jgi:phosphate transport system protein
MTLEQAHIHAAFDRDLEAIQARIMKMGGMVETGIAEAAKALELRDQDRADQVVMDDLQVDRLELLVDEEAARLIALRQPNATDLRTVLAVMKIAGNLERVGDYAKNIAKRTRILVEVQPVNGASASLRRQAKAVELMLRDALDAYIQRDVDLARDVIQRDREVDQMYNSLFREFLTHMMEDPRNITACMHLHFIAKNIERMGDHVTAVAEQVVYLVTGERPTDDRPKADSTTLDSAAGGQGD